jgi:hypothetical protein
VVFCFSPEFFEKKGEKIKLKCKNCDYTSDREELLIVAPENVKKLQNCKIQLCVLRSTTTKLQKLENTLVPILP